MKAEVLLYIIVMALVTYSVRMIPFAVFGKKVNNRFLKSFFFYVPYAVLSAMTVPYVFFSAGNVICSVFGFIAALVLAYFNRSLITVAFSSCLVAFLTNLVITYIIH